MPKSELHLSKLRKELSDIDRDFIKLVAKRQEKIQAISKVKQSLSQPIFDPQREERQFLDYDSLSEKLHLNKTLIRALFRLLIAESKTLQQSNLEYLK